MNVLVIGSGGREHAIVWKLRQSPLVRELYCAPGNAGIEALATLVPLQAGDWRQLLEFAKTKNIDLTVVGPEQPLVDGVVDRFEEEGLNIFGPRKAAARLEGSKVFAKEFMQRHGIPTARYRWFSAEQRKEAVEYLRNLSMPVVIKADGLAAGKGVVLAETEAEAERALDEMMLHRRFGAAGERVVIEEHLRGEEASVFVITDGSAFVALAPAQDHKRIFDGDRGKNTGGMGALAPTPLIDEALMQRIIRDIVRPTLDGMRAEGIPYRGCLYCGLMITETGPQLLEYNCRFGDPEAQVVIPLIDADFAALLLSAAQGTMQSQSVRRHAGFTVCVVMASRGYPDAVEVGNTISGCESFANRQDLVLFHAGTKRKDGALVTAGGRVLGVTALGFGLDLETTIERAYRAVESISFEGAQFRRDIGRKALSKVHGMRA